MSLPTAYRLSFALAFLSLIPCIMAGPMVTGEKMQDFASVFPLDKSQSNFKVVLIKTNAPGCIFPPNEQPQLTFQIQNTSRKPIQTKATLQVIGYGTRGIDGNIWLPKVYKIDDVASYPIDVNLPAKGWQNITVNFELPQRKGGYAAVLDMGEFGKQLAARMSRTFKHEIEQVQYPKQSLENLAPAILSRMGIHAVRYAVNYHNSDHPSYQAQLAKLEHDFAQMKKFGVTATVEIGAGNTRFPLGMPRPHLDENNVMQQGKKDHTWLPQDDDDYQQLCKLIAAKYGWPKGPVIGMMLWNEPWEGRSISGWQADVIRYRELYKRMGIAVHEARAEAGVDVLVGGCDSSSNTWDKLFPNDSDEFLNYLDFCSIHYQGMNSPALYEKWVNRKVGNGRVLIWDTESWVANTDDRLAGVVATNRAAGYDRSMGVYGGNISTWHHHHGRPTGFVFDDNGKRVKQPLPVQTWPLAASVSAVQHFLGERDFNRILFQQGLPWVYVFDGLKQNTDDGTIVVVGDLGMLFGKDQLLYRTITSIDQAKAVAAGKIDESKHLPLENAYLILPADPDFGLYDFYGNAIAANNGHWTIPLDDRGFFLRADPTQAGSFKRLTKAVKTAKIQGYEPLEIIPHDILAAIDSSTLLPVKITNVLNRPVTGQLKITLADTTLFSQSITVEPAQTQTLQLSLADVKPNAENTYAFKATFQTDDDDFAYHQENLHVNLISHRSITVDGKLDDWQGTFPQTITANGKQTRTLTEAAWLPFEKFDAADSQGLATGFLAYDKDYFYFAVKVADSSVDTGTLRFETRDQDADFYPLTSYHIDDKTSKKTQLTWPEGVRRFSYRQSPELPSGNAPNRDNILIAFNVIPYEQEPQWITHLPGRMPGFVGYKCTDHEYALNTVAEQYGGGYEVWRMAYPGMTHKHFYPRQPKHPLEGAVGNAKMITVHQGNTRITELAMPWSEIPLVKAKLDAGEPIKFSFKVHNNTGGPNLELSMNRGVARQNNLSFHTDWKQSWSNEVQFKADNRATKN